MPENNIAANRLAEGIIVYMIGNLSSKILQMLILPIITVSLLTSEYGYYDLIVTTISLVTPIVTLQIIEGMFRFMFNSDEEEKRKTVSTVTAFLLCGTVALAGVIAILHFALPSMQYPILIFVNYSSNILLNYIQKLARCQQQNKQFAISGVINTIVMLACQVLALLVFNLGVDGMLLANAVSYFVASAYLMFHIKIQQWFSIYSIDKKTFKELLKYSAPLILNSIGWWVVSSSDRYIILFFLGVSANGIYSIAAKFSQLLTFVTSVFQLAWQESAILEENSEGRDRFYSTTFNTYMKLLMGGYLFILPFIKLIIPFLLAESYQEGYLYVPALLIGAVFSAFSQFYGSAYLVFKKTGGAVYTTFIAAAINLLIGVGLVHWLGLFAPALGTATSFLVQWLLRAYQMKEYFKVTIQINAFVALLICGGVVTTAYYVNNVLTQIICMACGLLIFLYINKDIISSILYKMHIIKK